MKKSFAIALAVTLVFSAMAVNAETILLSMKGPGAGNPFWAAVEKGAREKAKEIGVDLVVLAPPQESDITSQIAQIEDQMTKGVDGIALAPTDPDALAPIVDEALAEGTKVVFVDTNGKNKGVTFIGTNNEMGAKLAADYICKNVPKGSDVAILQGIIVHRSIPRRRFSQGIDGVRFEHRRRTARRLGPRKGPVGHGEHPCRQSEY